METENKTACLKVVAARLEFKKRLDAYQSKYDLKAINLCHKGAKARMLHAINENKITKAIIFPNGVHMSSLSKDGDRVVIWNKKTCRYSEITTEILKTSIEQIEYEDIVVLVKTMQERKKRQMKTTRDKTKLEIIESQTITLKASDVLSELISSKVTENRKVPTFSLKIEDVSTPYKKHENNVELNELSRDIQKICVEFYNCTKEKRKHDNAIKQDRAKLKQYEQKYQTCIENFCPEASKKEFAATISENKYQITKEVKQRKVEMNGKLIKTMIQKLCQTCSDKSESTDRADRNEQYFKKFSQMPYSKTVAIEFSSTEFKNRLFSILNKSLIKWNKSEDAIQKKVQIKHKKQFQNSKSSDENEKPPKKNQDVINK